MKVLISATLKPHYRGEITILVTVIPAGAREQVQNISSRTIISPTQSGVIMAYTTQNV